MSENSKEQLSKFQTIGTALALFISIMALGVSAYEANLMRSQQSAMVWPYLKISGSYSEGGFSFVANNNGTGPAIIKSLEVRYKNEAMHNYNELLDTIKPDRKIGYESIRMSKLNNTVVKAGEERELFNMDWNEESRIISKSMRYVTVKICYCSVLGDCWVYNSDEDELTEGTFKSEIEFEN